ncbi:MAG: bacterial transcriptional activator domain-containing protein [Myxococcota bacterium]|nr:bacterial transcriptional activator domain-containing protein [Myxococcota bacterium]
MSFGEIPAGLAQRREGAWVIPPGQERLVAHMLGGEPIAGCSLLEARIERSHVEARWRCARGEGHARLAHPDALAHGRRSERFAFEARGPHGFAEALEARLREREEPFVWSRPTRDRNATFESVPTAVDPAPSLPEPAARAYAEALALYRGGAYREAHDRFVAIARTHPRGGALGMVVASLASQRPDEPTALALQREADARPGDPLTAFVAAVAWHYWAHQRAASAEQKRRGYRRAIALLERARAAYDFEPRLHIYLAVSHYRLGHQADAEHHIERAIAVGPDDPDAFYCRAEIRQHVDPTGAIADLDRYLEMTAELRRQGAVIAEGKLERVLAMRRHLHARMRGHVEPRELFDPTQEPAMARTDGLERVQLGIAWVLSGLALASLVLAAGAARRWLGTHGVGRAVLLAAGAAALARLLVPGGPVMQFVGYRWTAQVLALDAVPHYGAGVAVLDHALLRLFGADHAVLIGARAVMGTASVGLAAAAFGMWLRDARAGLLAAWLVALLPVVVRMDVSEAIGVPVMLALFGALVLLGDAVRTGRRRSLVAAALLAAFAAIGRPEGPLLAGALVGLRIASERRRPRGLLVACLAATALVVPHALHVARMAAELAARDSLPGAKLDAASLLNRLLETNALLDPAIVPPALLVLAALGVLVPRGSRRASTSLAVSVLVALVVVLADLDRSNVARVHLPAVLLAAGLAGAGLSRLRALPSGRWLASAGLLSVAVGAWPTARALFGPDNQATEEAFLRRAAAALADRRDYDLVFIQQEDRLDDGPWASFTHDHVPLYLFPGARPRSITALVWSGPTDREAYALLGMRCHARFRPWGTPPPSGSTMQPACERLRASVPLEPVVVWDVPNHGDRLIAYWPAAPRLRIGLYRIASLRAHR